MIILKYLDMQYIFVAKNLCHVLPLEATTFSLFLMEIMQPFSGLQQADAVVEMFRCLTIFILNQEDQFLSLLIFAQWVSCAQFILWARVQSVLPLYVVGHDQMQVLLSQPSMENHWRDLL